MPIRFAKPRTFLVLFGWMATAALFVLFALLPVSLFGLLLPAALLPRGNALRTRLYRFYRAACNWGSATWCTCAAALLESLAGLRVRTYGQPLAPSDRTVLVIANHHCRLDWMFLWCVFARLGRLRSLKVALKAGLKKVPVFGWAAQSFLYIFLERQMDGGVRGGSVGCITRVLDHCVGTHGEPMTLLLFPEGTDLSPSNVARSNVFGASKGLPPTKFTLQPRTAGFVAAVQSLGGRLDAVLDLTLSYTSAASPDGTAGSPDADRRPSEKTMLRGQWPSTIHVEMQRVAAAELPAAHDAVALANWLTARWATKEATLAARDAAFWTRRVPDYPPAVQPPPGLLRTYLFTVSSLGACLGLLAAGLSASFAGHLYVKSYIGLGLLYFTVLTSGRVGGLDSLALRGDANCDAAPPSRAPPAAASRAANRATPEQTADSRKETREKLKRS